MAERLAGGKLEPQLAVGPDDGRLTVPAIEAVVERNTVDWAGLGEVPLRRHADALGRQHLGIGKPDRRCPAGKKRLVIACEEGMQTEARRHGARLEVLDS